MTIKEIKYKAEKIFEKNKLQNDVYGFQIQPNTKFLKGISRKEIDKLETIFGFDFPWEYREMLLNIGGLDTQEISIDPDGEVEVEFHNFFYQYPRDIEKVQHLFEDINANMMFVEEALTEAGFDVSKVVGYIPIYYHRILVVFKNKYLSPVISAWGADIIIYGNNLEEYLKNEFLRY
ncbi:SMI1/KNR4 family protein [Flavobacterium aquicola]|uniref:Knr4/Smi1-like domain-containing protein n=1 Tax=Flavobacterium aquicola TaxID=1682742 RepID=A0A3E0EU47_9FLAO|nr:SMI1/KNR4 family protein [Flavobacterium aquicola]REH01686.1 hypothetical protein C8P67_101166 [Flavobacterium aquicola]